MRTLKKQVATMVSIYLFICCQQTQAETAKVIEVDGYSIVEVGTIPVRHPAFLTLDQSKEGTYQLFISTFGFIDTDTLSVVHSLSESSIRNGSAQVKLLSDQITWPNEVTAVGPEFFGKSGWLVSGGFLVPGKSTGAITFIDAETYQVIPITAKKSEFFYHRAQLVHWGPQQSIALLTARSKVSFFGSTASELVLLVPKQPFLDLSQVKDGASFFDERVLVTGGPDVFFQAKDLDGDGVEELVAAEYFSKKLELFWWDDNQLKSRIIDSDLGATFDLSFAHLRNPEQWDLVVTNHEAGQGGAVYAYEIPGNFKYETWRKHVLLNKISARHFGLNSAAPGSPLVFSPSANGPDRPWSKPWIFVSGDGSEQAYLLTPNARDNQEWNYKKTTLLNAKSTIGKAAIGDVDRDGSLEIFIPEYDANRIDVFRIVPKQPQVAAPSFRQFFIDSCCPWLPILSRDRIRLSPSPESFYSI